MKDHEHLTRRIKISLRKDILTDDYFQLTFVIGLCFLFLCFTSYLICSNASGGSTWKSTTDLDFNATSRIFNHTIINETGVGANVRLESAADWWAQNINAPPSRVDYAMAALGNDDKIILFGGYTGFIRLKDTWMYDLSDNNWTQMYPSNAPSPRDGHAMATVYNDDKVILFGGFYSSGTEPRTNYNDTWIYDYSDNQWYNISTSFSPSPRCAHAMALIDTTSEILLYGGFSDALWELSDTWIFNISMHEWRQINSTNMPSAASRQDV